MLVVFNQNPTVSINTTLRVNKKPRCGKMPATFRFSSDAMVLALPACIPL